MTPKPRAVVTIDPTHVDPLKLEMSKRIGTLLMETAAAVGHECVITACIGTTITLALGTAALDKKDEVAQITSDFLNSILDLRDVLREDATNTQPLPKQVM